MKKLTKAAPALGRLGIIILALAALVLVLCLASFCLLVIFKTDPTTLLYPLGALT